MSMRYTYICIALTNIKTKLFMFVQSHILFVFGKSLDGLAYSQYFNLDVNLYGINPKRKKSQFTLNDGESVVWWNIGAGL